MIPLVQLLYHGDVRIEFWEYGLSLVYIGFLYLYFARRKNLELKKGATEYRYYVWGMMAKVSGGAVFSLIYFYYYQGGDTMSYFYSAVSMSKLAVIDPGGYLQVLFGENSEENRRLFSMETGFPYAYVYNDKRTFMVIRLTSLLAIATFNSYLVSTVLVASFSFFGIWACYRTFVSYFPQAQRGLAIAFLFMPSLLFWGSSILKDTFTFSAVCWWVHAVDEVFFKRRKTVGNAIIMALSGLVMVVIKPYIFIALLPVTLLWLLYFRVAGLRNALVKFLVVPMAAVSLLALSFLVLDRMGDAFDKFALDKALRTIEVSQDDLTRTEAYGAGFYDIGELDGTWGGVLRKFPVAVNAALFRPYLWEASSFVMALSALENLWVLGLMAFVLFRAGPWSMLRYIVGNPLLLMSMGFTLLFAFVVGVSTPNFGALVRFKIPMVPFFIGGLYIILFLTRLERATTRQGGRFSLRELRKGTAHIAMPAGGAKPGGKRPPGRTRGRTSPHPAKAH